VVGEVSWVDEDDVLWVSVGVDAAVAGSPGDEWRGVEGFGEGGEAVEVVAWDVEGVGGVGFAFDDGVFVAWCPGDDVDGFGGGCADGGVAVVA